MSSWTCVLAETPNQDLSIPCVGEERFEFRWLL